MHLKRWVGAGLVGVALGLLTHSVAALADDIPYWPTDQERRLKEVDAQVLEMQRQRFRALFGKDHEEAERLDKRFKDLQKERRELLHATGRIP